MDVWVCCLHVFYDLNTSIMIEEQFGSRIVRGKLMTFFSLLSAGQVLAASFSNCAKVADR